jgi:hypothetical protein
MCIDADGDYPRGEHIGHKPSGAFFCHSHPHEGHGPPRKKDVPDPDCEYCQRLAAFWQSGVLSKRYIDGIRRYVS